MRETVEAGLTAPSGHFLSRADRAKFIATNFAPYLRGCRVLDVGCGDALLRTHVESYVGIDIAGQPDIRVDLEQVSIPFRDDAFGTVVCTEVIEHIEPLADVLGELFRTAHGYVIISVPNMYALGWRLKFLRGQVISKEYSLTPSNRHKWLPSLAEARSLLRVQAPPGWQVKWEFGYQPPAWWRRGPLYRLLSRAYPNLLCTSYWVLLEYASRDAVDTDGE